MRTITLQKGEKLTIEQAMSSFGTADAHEVRANMSFRGPWSIISGFEALCVHQDFGSGEITIYGKRRLQNIKQSGYQLEGTVSIAGKKHTAFTSSHLFELDNGHLISVATIFPRIS